MRATTQPAEGNRVRLSVEVDAAEIDDAVGSTIQRLAQQVRVPGFRPGRAPRPIIEARFGGAEAVRRQAISDALPGLYARAVTDAEIDPIAVPDIDLVKGEDGGDLVFEALVEVRPVITVAGYQGLEVTLPSLSVTAEELERHIDRLREQSGELSEVDRPAASGDVATIDVHGARPDGEDIDFEDYMYEIGSGSDIPGLDDGLVGAKPSDVLHLSAPVSDGSGDGESDGGVVESERVADDSERAVSFTVTLKEVREKILPPADDAWASTSSEFDTLTELRADTEVKLKRFKAMQAQMAFRDLVVDALVALVSEEPPGSLVDAEVNERIHDLNHRLSGRGMSFEQFLSASGRDVESIREELKAEAIRAVQLDLALRALAEAEDLAVDDAELADSIAEMAAEVGLSVKELTSRLDRGGRLVAVRSDRRKAKALDWLMERVGLVDEDGRPVSREELFGNGDGSGAGDDDPGVEGDGRAEEGPAVVALEGGEAAGAAGMTEVDA